MDMRGDPGRFGRCFAHQNRVARLTRGQRDVHDRFHAYPSNVKVSTQVLERRLSIGVLKRVPSSISRFGIP